MTAEREEFFVVDIDGEQVIVSVCREAGARRGDPEFSPGAIAAITEVAARVLFGVAQEPAA